MAETTAGRPAAPGGSQVGRRDWRMVVLNSFRELTLVPVIIVLMIAGAIVNPVFFTSSNLINVAQGGADLGMVVVAESLILLTGKFDISLQGTFGLAALLGAWLIAPKLQAGGPGTQWSPYVGVLIVLGVGLVAESWFGIPVSVWVTVSTFIVAAAFLRYHRVGRAMYAIGGNLEAARAAGIKVDRIRIGVFMVASVLAAVGGLMQAGRVTAVTAGQGSNLIFGVFAAAVIGGVSLDGGRGRMVGALTGVILLSLVTNILTLSNISSTWIDAVDGAIILIALGLAKVIGTERA